jgi:D-3-phosphoglycerate dehydrogenase
MGMPLLGYDIMTLPQAFCTETGLSQVDLPYLLRHADVIILACVLTSNNRHLLAEEAFGQMKRGVLIVNVARGPLIKESALLTALDCGQVAGAALDVFETEPLTTFNPLCNYSQVILGSHNSSNTEEAVLRVNQLAIDNLSRDLKKVAAKQL